ncbi:MAG: hypothetical protein ACI4ME_06820 [Aristaeellaceae bacterium]
MINWVILLAYAGVLVLQVFLSKTESKWPGLVLPGIAFLMSLMYPFLMVAPSEGVTVGFIAQMILVWLLGNIPTLILLGIYFACRGKKKRSKQIEKMNIQDLD